MMTEEELTEAGRLLDGWAYGWRTLNNVTKANLEITINSSGKKTLLTTIGEVREYVDKVRQDPKPSFGDVSKLGQRIERIENELRRRQFNV